MDYRQEPHQEQQCAFDQDRLCPNVIRLEAKMDEHDKWREEVSRRLDNLSALLEKLLIAVLGTLLTAILSLVLLVLNKL